MESEPILLLAGFTAGAMNSAAGGGSFVSFPCLVFLGVPSVYANATSSAALLPGSLAGAWAYRRECRAFDGAPLAAMTWVSLAGGLAGALLLRATPARTFEAAVPWLLFAGATAFALGPRAARLTGRAGIGGRAWLLLAQGMLAVYGGYFGGAAGIMMMAAWGLFGVHDIQAMNAAKTLLVGVTNLAAVGCFAATGLVRWEACGVMLAGAVVGGYAGACFARRVEPRRLRTGINLVNVAVTVAFFVKAMR